jgi:hypothetical protein
MTNNNLNLQRILLVEDNPEFAEAAIDHLHSRGITYYWFSSDYENAMKFINDQDSNRFTGVISDCFFPRNYSSDITLGKVAIEKMESSDTVLIYINRFIEEFGKHVNLDDKLRKAVTNLAWHEFYSPSREDKDPSKNRTIKDLALNSKTSGKENATRSCNDMMTYEGSSYLRDDREMVKYMGQYDKLREAIKKDPSNQPLGILIADECENRGIPKVLATSSFHHDMLTQPIQTYCALRKWNLVDCSKGRPGEKAQASFWQRAYDSLLREMGGRR